MNTVLPPRQRPTRTATTTSARHPSLTESATWQALRSHQRSLQANHLRDLFASEPERFGRFSVRVGGLFLDYSKNLISAKTLRLLFKLAGERDVEGWRERMFDGTRINHTEDRAVLHTLLRGDAGRYQSIARSKLGESVAKVLAQVETFTREVRDGTLRGATGQVFTDVVNIGIGGSDLGPQMVVRALQAGTSQYLRTHFVSNVDATDLEQTLSTLDPERTLFIVASKTFTTQETMLNACTARAWLTGRLGTQTAVASHFVALSTNLAATAGFGIRADRVFEFWDWVGGRFSLWSAIGLSIALAVGMDSFRKLLAGAKAMDEHFQDTQLEDNMPVILAMLGVWYTNFWNCRSHAVLPYDHRLSRLPAFLQQLEMESNGKSVTREGRQVEYQTVPIIWGETGTNGQHAFFQMLHQGTQLVPADFITCANSCHSQHPHHAALLANCLAQTRSLAFGKSEPEALIELLMTSAPTTQARLLAPYKSFAGNRPTNTLLLDSLSAENLGALIALYEHKTFVQGVIWNLNSFDQWGVELGKKLAIPILERLCGNAGGERFDSSTEGLLNQIAASRTNRPPNRLS